MKLTWAGQAEILRAAEKDQQHIASNTKDLLGGLSNVFGPRSIMPYHQKITSGCTLAYYALSTVFDFQTLGEQFVHIVRCTPEGTPVSFLRRLLLLAEHIPWKVSDPDIQDLLSIATRLHLIHFYLFGEYSSISRRLARSRYALFRNFLDMSHLSWIFKAIAYMYIAKMIKEILQKAAEKKSIRSELTKEGDKSQLICAMCNDFAINCTITRCGHVFCWDCIARWAHMNRSCASCREIVEPEQLTRIWNR
ncbi:peroxisome biogenesis factor 10 [Galendromus occidentalis]|uniref:RING-type E3 ubiquitin transferase n=1 Tax=Galendromus occidentalis TaxID=34638 RepID=A0AAJ6VWK5_9ACAR|nr:peroxisome biogenesis factor 10 [Galendromus occidentalis]